MCSWDYPDNGPPIDRLCFLGSDPKKGLRPRALIASGEKLTGPVQQEYNVSHRQNLKTTKSHLKSKNKTGEINSGNIF